MEDNCFKTKELCDSWLKASVAACAGQLSSELGDESVILNVESGVYYGLSGVATRIWQLVQTPLAIPELRQVILEEYDVTSEVCDRDLQKLLTDLEAVNLIKINHGAHT